MPYSYNNQWHRDPYSEDDCADFFCHFSGCDEMWEAHHRKSSAILLSYSQFKGQAHRVKEKKLMGQT